MRAQADPLRSTSRQSGSDKSVSQLLNPKVRRRLPVPEDEDPLEDDEENENASFRPIFSPFKPNCPSERSTTPYFRDEDEDFFDNDECFRSPRRSSFHSPSPSYRAFSPSQSSTLR